MAKSLTQQLQELERDGLIVRKIFPEVPPEVEYQLSKLGNTIIAVLNSLCEWGKNYQEQVSAYGK